MTEPAAKRSRMAYPPEQEKQLAELITYRRPKQDRGAMKFESILDAAHELINSKGVHNFSLYDIAKHADVAVGSVYHFFPGIEAVFAALVERYDREFAEIVSEDIPLGEIESWGDIIWDHIERARYYVNENSQVLIMLLGPGQTWQTRQVDTVGDTAVARAMWKTISEYFDIPASPDPAELLHYAIRILESIWQLSYQRHGNVTPEMQQETYRAMCAYLELYWPKHMQRKESTVIESPEQ